MINFGDKVRVIKVKSEKAMNLWGGFDDISWLVGLEATVKSIYDKDTPSEMYGLEFEHWGAQVTRDRTGYVFDKEEIELLLAFNGGEAEELCENTNI